MLLRMLWSRLGAQRPVEWKPVCVYLSRSLKPRAYGSKSRTHSNLSALRILSRNYHMNSLHPQLKHTTLVPPASAGSESNSSTLTSDPGTLTPCGIGPKRFYSTDLGKSALKPSLKPAPVPGKRVPKGPRTKQPSRANQPSLNVDKVIQSSDSEALMTHVSVIHCSLCFSLGYDAMYRLRNSRSVPFANTLPRLDKPRLP